MDILHKNLEIIKQLRPFLYKCIEPYLNSTNYNIVPIDQNHFNLQYVIDGKPRILYDIHPIKDYQRSQNLSNPKNPRILIFDGFGLGYHILEYLKSPVENCLYYVMIEKQPEVFVAALKTRDWTPVLSSPQFEIFVGTPRELMQPAMRDYLLVHERVIYSDSIEHFYLHHAMTHDGEFYVDFANATKQAVEALKTLYIAPAEDAYRGLINVVHNLDQFHQHTMFDGFKGLLKGQQALLVASGPSLNTHLEQLKKNYHKFFVVCCDSTFQVLLKHRITPDLVFSAERIRRIEDLFKDIPSDCSVPLVALPTAYPAVLKNYPGPIVMVSRETTFGRWLWPDCVYFDLGENVASMALSLLSFMECDSVYLLGQDLAYDRFSEKTHVDGVSEDTQKIERQRQKTGEYCEIMGNNETPIGSTIYWEDFKNSINRLIAKLSIKCYNVIPKDYGAKIPNATQLEPSVFWSEIAAHRTKKDLNHQVLDILQRRESSVTSAEKYQKLTHDALEYLNQLIEEVFCFIDDISYDIHCDFPVEINDQVLKDYQKKFKVWQARQQKLMAMDPKIFQGLVRPVFLTPHYKGMTALENTKLNPDDVCDYILNYADRMQDWGKNLCYWAMRIKRVLELPKRI